MATDIRSQNKEDVKVFGADWCSTTRSTLEHLDSVGVQYLYVDVEKDPQASEWVKEQNEGTERRKRTQTDARHSRPGLE